MSTKKLILAIILAVAAAGTIFLVLPKQDDSLNTSNTGTGTENNGTANPSVETETTASTFTAAQVAEHDTRNDCWTIINGSVYNLTSYISSHPGGDEILRACGNDATTLFNQRETEDGEEVGSGTPHSSTARSQLERLKIGTFAQ